MVIERTSAMAVFLQTSQNMSHELRFQRISNVIKEREMKYPGVTKEVVASKK